MVADRQEIAKWFKTFKADNEAVEIRIVYNDGHMPKAQSWYVNDADSISELLESISRSGHVYWNLNAFVEAPANGKALSDADITTRSWILIDFDPKRMHNTSATDAEKAEAYKVMTQVMGSLRDMGFPEPVVADSGNGYHLFLKVNEPSTEDTTRIIEQFLHTLADMFNTDQVDIDTSVSNPSRICKLPGTMAVKGENTKSRPHRMAKLLQVPENIREVDMSIMPIIVAKYGNLAKGMSKRATRTMPQAKIVEASDFDTDIRVRSFVEAWEAQGIVLDDYNDYMEMAMALSRGGHDYESYFHRVCRGSEKYDYEDAHLKFTNALRTCNSIGIGKFFYLCRKYGVDPQASTKADNGFPYEVFPHQVQELINKAHESRLKFPRVYTACGILCATSCAIGNVFAVEFTKEHTENAVLYMALVGGKGKNKSHPLSMAVKPLSKMDNMEYEQFKADMARYCEDQDRPKKERIGTPRPERHQHIAGDTTAEALAMVMANNPRGIMVVADELMGWIKAQNQYRSGNGSDAEMWLSLWSGKAHDVIRKTSASYRIDRPFVSVCGTIQPSIIPSLAENREANGFLDRILFAWPQDIKFELMSENDPEMDEGLLNMWDNVIHRIVGIPFMGHPINVQLSEDADKMFIQWQRAEAEKCNRLDNQRICKTDDVAYNGIHAKMQSYCLRFSLILEVLRKACDPGMNPTHIGDISAESMDGALRLCTYFTNQALEVRNIMNESDIERLTQIQRELYTELPDAEFTTAEGMEVAKSLNIPERTFKRFLAKTKYFKCIARGKYEKNL